MATIQIKPLPNTHPRIEEGVTNKAFDAEEGEGRTRDSVVSCIMYMQHSIQRSIQHSIQRI